MPNSVRLTFARLTAVAVAAAALTACASTGGRHDAARPSDTAFVVGSTGWLNGNFETPGPAEPNAPTRAPAESPALRATSPWIGTIGLRQLLPGNWEIGLGVAVPNPGGFAPNVETVPPTDRFHGAGVGLWLKLDF
jgi:hypothetical protein